MLPGAIASGKAHRPSTTELIYQAFLLGQLAKLTRGRGGMTPNQRQQATSEGEGMINARMAEAGAGLARGSAGTPGASGAAQKSQTDLYKAGLAASQQSRSEIRGADLRLAAQKRNEVMNQWMAMTGLRQQAKEAGAAHTAGMSQSQKVPASSIPPKAADDAAGDTAAVGSVAGG